MAIDWLWKSLVSRIVWECIIGGGLLTALKENWPRAGKWPQVGAFFFYFIVAVACLLAIHLALTGRPVLSVERVVPANVQDYILKWNQDLGWGSEPLTVSGNTFTIDVNFHNQIKIEVERKQESKTRYIRLETAVREDPNLQQYLDKLTSSQAELLNQETTVALAAAKYAFSMTTPMLGKPYSEIQIFKDVPIEGLSEASYENAIEDMKNGVVLIQEYRALNLRRSFPNASLPYLTQASPAN